MYTYSGNNDNNNTDSISFQDSYGSFHLKRKVSNLMCTFTNLLDHQISIFMLQRL